MTVTGTDLLPALPLTLRAMDETGALPPLIPVGFINLEPEAFLRACCRLLLDNSTDMDTAEVDADFVPLETERHIADDSPEIWKWCIVPDFTAPHLIALGKRQAWTVKPATPA